MTVIGLTGGSGSGKGLFSEFFRQQGIPTLDTDAVYHRLVSADSPCLRELVAAFGPGILQKSGGLFRPALAEIVFRPDEEREARMQLLSDITHKYVKQACLRWLSSEAEKNSEFAVLDVPLLFESGFDQICDVTVAVLADRATRLRRITARDALTTETALRRIDAQPADEYYISRADFCIENDASVSDFMEKAAQCFDQIKHLKGRVK